MADQLLCISGAYRTDGITDQAIVAIAEQASRCGWACHHVRLIEKNIAFCRNCRNCTQAHDGDWGHCPIQDDVADILERVHQSQALVLASPVNYYDVTAITRVFLERLLPCAYWPWGQYSPRWRNKTPQRPALLVTSTAMPAFMARFGTRSMKSLADMARSLRAVPVGRFFIGGLVVRADQRLDEPTLRRLRRAVAGLLDEKHQLSLARQVAARAR